MTWKNLKKNNPFLLFNEEGGRFKYPTKFDWLSVIYLAFSAIYITVFHWKGLMTAGFPVIGVYFVAFLLPLAAIVFLKFVNVKRVDWNKPFISVFRDLKLYLSYICDSLLYLYLYSLQEVLIGKENAQVQIIVNIYFGGFVVNTFKIYGITIRNAIILGGIIFLVGIPNTEWWVFYALIFALINLLVSEEAYLLFAHDKEFANEKK